MQINILSKLLKTEYVQPCLGNLVSSKVCVNKDIDSAGDLQKLGKTQQSE